MFPLVQLIEVSQRLPAQAMFSGRTAAWLHRLDVQPCDPIEVTLPRRAFTSRLAGLSLIRSDVADAEMGEVGGLRVTSCTRTMADLGRRLPLVEATAILDMALHSRITDKDRLERWVVDHRGYHGIRSLRNALDLADAAAESPMETRLRLLLVKHGLPRPRVQVSLYDGAGMFLARTDLYYPDSRLAIEYDGMNHRSRLAADNRRQNRLLEAGYRLLRFTASDINRTPAAVVGQVKRGLETYSSSASG